MSESEDRIQAECVEWFWNTFPEYRRLLFHIPNGGKRTKIEAGRFKAMGVLPGIPDLFFSYPNKGYHGMYIEMKKPGEIPHEHDRKVTDHEQRQIDQMMLFANQGYHCVYCDSVERFKSSIIGYLKHGTEPGYRPIR